MVKVEIIFEGMTQVQGVETSQVQVQVRGPFLFGTVPPPPPQIANAEFGIAAGFAKQVEQMARPPKPKQSGTIINPGFLKKPPKGKNPKKPKKGKKNG